MLYLCVVKVIYMDQSLNIVEESSLTYGTVDDSNVFRLINAIRAGINFPVFDTIAKQNSFTLNEWSGFLHLSERTMQRYQKEKKTFDPSSSERIIEIVLLVRFGVEVFGNSEKFTSWLETSSVSLGGRKPKDLLDNTFGIGLLKDELTRIEHGILA
jgi:putative toxin-antitoxin system antitoxin component (TIGR02293 family)